MSSRGNSPRDGDLMRWWLKNRGELDDYTDADVERSCTSKTSYPSESAARAYAAMNGTSRSLSTYHCRYCDGWHLTKRQS